MVTSPSCCHPSSGYHLQSCSKLGKVRGSLSESVFNYCDLCPQVAVSDNLQQAEDKPWKINAVIMGKHCMNSG